MRVKFEDNSTVNLRHIQFYLVVRIRINGAVPPVSLIPSRITKEKFQIVCKGVEMIFPSPVTHPCNCCIEGAISQHISSFLTVAIDQSLQVE